MPHYYFSIENGERIRDPLGEDLPDDAAALSVAQHVAQDLARAKLNPAGMRVVVRSSDDVPIGTAWVRDWKADGHHAQEVGAGETRDEFLLSFRSRRITCSSLNMTKVEDQRFRQRFERTVIRRTVHCMWTDSFLIRLITCEIKLGASAGWRRLLRAQRRASS